MAYVAMSRGRDSNQAYIYTRDDPEAGRGDGDVLAAGEIHQLQRGNIYAAAHHLRSIAANDDRPRTMHLEARQTERDALPDSIRRALALHDQRLASREIAWRQHSAAARHWRAGYERMAANIPGAGRSRGAEGIEI